MGGSRTETLLLLLTGIVLLLMVALIGLFLRMEQLQREVLAALEPLRQAPNPSGLFPGTKAPAFTLPDLSGQPVSLDAFAGREVLLVFAFPGCPACREMYVPELGYRICCYPVCGRCPGACCWYTGQWGCFCPYCTP
ncbi:MAG: peroxiredoxin family protein [Anaerolineae bacterium]|nr:peroxiredoxin family protein [Anaerolineae bacterium]